MGRVGLGKSTSRHPHYDHQPSSFLFLVRPGAPSSVLAPSSVALVTTSKALVPSSFLFLVVMTGATSSVLAPGSDALCSV